MKLKKVHIQIRPIKDVKAEWRSALHGEIKAIRKPDTLVFTSLTAVAKILSPVRLELLGAIIKHKPDSISSLARIIGRDFKNIYADVHLLSAVGILELRSVGKRDSVRPVALYSGIELDLVAA